MFPFLRTGFSLKPGSANRGFLYRFVGLNFFSLASPPMLQILRAGGTASPQIFAPSRFTFSSEFESSERTQAFSLRRIWSPLYLRYASRSSSSLFLILFPNSSHCVEPDGTRRASRGGDAVSLVSPLFSPKLQDMFLCAARPTCPAVMRKEMNLRFR